MDITEYKIRMLEIERDAEQKKRQLITECALSNNIVKIGDTFTDHIGTIRVEKIKIASRGDGRLPECVYFGAMLRKDLTPFKSGEKRDAYESNKVK